MNKKVQSEGSVLRAAYVAKFIGAGAIPATPKASAKKRTAAGKSAPKKTAKSKLPPKKGKKGGKKKAR